MSEEEKTPEELQAEQEAAAKAALEAKNAEEAAKAEEARKAEEAKKAEDAKKAAQPGAMSEDQIAVLEKQTGLSRSQMVGIGMIVQAALQTGPQAELAESHAIAKASQELSAQKIADFASFEGEIKKELEKLAPSQRQN